ncbi:MAG: CRISPR-associated endonuclease Cas1 [Candidatus Nezhaarchaeales archaeon]
MPLKIILPKHGYRISKKGGMLVIYKHDGSKKEISVGNVSIIMANLRGLSISGDALRLMLKHGVQLILLSHDKPIGKIQPMMLKTHVKLRKEQVKAQSDLRGTHIARTIVLNKIMNQIKVSKRFLKVKRGLEWEKAVKVEELIQQMISVYRNVSEEIVSSRSWLISKEAEASRYYWEIIAEILPKEIGFTGRRKKYENPEDPLNLSLNYLYTLLMYQVWYAVELSGLDPFIGYLHEDSSKRPSLVMDLIEEFRQPIIDLPLITYFIKQKNIRALDSGKRLEESFRNELLKIFFSTLEKNVTFLNRTAPIKTHIRLQPIRLAKYLLGYTDTYRCFDVV